MKKRGSFVKKVKATKTMNFRNSRLKPDERTTTSLQSFPDLVRESIASFSTQTRKKEKRLLFENKQERIHLYLEDCLTGMKRLDKGCVDVVVTSPPYNLGVKYNSYDDKIPRKKYLNWIYNWGFALKRVLSDKGSLFLNLGGKPSDPWVPYEVLFTLKELFCLQNTIHWIKSISVGKNGAVESFGHYKPINSKRFLNDCHEFIFHLTNNGSVELDRKAIGVPYSDKSNIERWQTAGDDIRCRGNTWFIPYKTIQNGDAERPHPATFPVELVEFCYKLHGTNKIRLAMDPFLGIGNAAIAAYRLNVLFIGFEIDENYLLEAQKKIEREKCRKS